jgi:hypothetical protein
VAQEVAANTEFKAAAAPVASAGSLIASQLAMFDALFTHADTSGSGKIGGREAVAFLSTSGLPKLMLREVRRC